MAEAWLYDGTNAVRHEVRVDRAADGLRILFADGSEGEVPRGKLCYVENRRGFDVYGRSDVQGWRLGLASGDVATFGPVLPRKARYGRLIDRIGLVPAVVGGIALSAAIIFVGMNFPAWVAPHVPLAWEEKFGDTLVGDFGGRFCEGKGGEAALRKLAARLADHPERLNIRVVHAPMMNAAALPGGNIVIFDELLKQSDGPDELAGVLAHEIAHVEERHTAEAMIRELGLGVFITALGGNTGANVEALLGASYSRAAESEADDVAIEHLNRAGISPAGTAKFFERMAKQEKRIGRIAEPLSYISTHPMSASREQKFRAGAVKGRTYAPSLSRDEWEALFNICYNDKRPHAQRWEPF